MVKFTLYNTARFVQYGKIRAEYEMANHPNTSYDTSLCLANDGMFVVVAGAHGGMLTFCRPVSQTQGTPLLCIVKDSISAHQPRSLTILNLSLFSVMHELMN